MNTHLLLNQYVKSEEKSEEKIALLLNFVCTFVSGMRKEKWPLLPIPSFALCLKWSCKKKIILLIKGYNLNICLHKQMNLKMSQRLFCV